MNKGLLATLVLAVTLGLAACSSKVSQENYAKIENGMAQAKVHELLGAPDTVSSTGIGSLTASTEVWKGDNESISITFMGEKVRMKSMSKNEEK